MSLKIDTVSSYQKLIIFASIIPLIVFGFLIYNNSKEERIQATSEHLQSLNEQNKEIVTTYFEELEFNTEELAKTVFFLQEQATQNIINIQNLQRNHIENYYHAVSKDIVSLGKKDVFQYIFNFLKRGKKVNQTYLDNIYKYKEELGIKNILMMDEDGKVLYVSDDKSLLHTNAAQLIASFKHEKRELKASLVVTGYNEALPSHKQYVVAPFKDVKGYIAIEINQDDIQKIIANVASLGKTAETYLAYKHNNKTYLASDRVLKEGKIGDVKSGEYINKGFTQEGTDIKYGSLGDIELVGFMPVKVNNITFSMQTTVAYTEIISPTIDGEDYFEQYMNKHDYHNIMLIGPQGDMFYSITKEDDYEKNILTGKYSKTSLSRAVQKIFETKKFVLTDIGYYPACENGISQFALLPLLRKDGSVQSIIAIELNLNKLSRVLIENKNIYGSYETYIVGDDFRLRSHTFLGESRYTLDKSFEENIFVNTQAVRNAFARTKGVGIVQDYRGVDVLSSFSLIEQENFKWAIISEVDEREVESMVSGLKYTILIFVLISSFVALVVMYVITNEKKKQDKKIHYTATHDALTGLANRKFALEFLTYILANTKRNKKDGAVLFLDLDKFKVINDSYGHKAGDLVLKETAKRLKNILRKDDLIARLGGDEFILVINSYKSIEDIDVLCKKMIEEISLPVNDEQRSYQVGISVGIATFPNDSSNAEELLQFSDTAMFKTKENGRNGFTYYSQEMTKKSLQISRVESELKDAIYRNELVLHFQPQVGLANGKVVGVESLVRWNHPQDGLIMPNDFIPIAEDSNLILELGYWVIYEACKTFKRWKNEGSDLEYIAVNMSTKQLQCPKCVQSIQMIFSELDFNPEYLELEITETTLIANLDSTVTNIELLKNMGIQFSIDDFGTGYSSLSYLKSLQISTLKIDREFIKDMVADKSDRTIVEAIIVMGHTLGYTIVAEGAETRAEKELLKYLACDIIQGYYYSKPLPEKEVLKYIKGCNNA